jgi:tRNA pseudouridine55 synthase
VLGQRKAGHGGTLDPFASGLLVCAFGRATRVNAFTLAHDKAYTATLAVGRATTTGDPEGEITAEGPVPALTRAAWQALADRLVGDIEQVPPMHSALKQDGRRLYELARQGLEVERSPRRVRIDALRVIDWTPPSLSIELRCSKGTYVRVLAEQLAALAATHAHLSALRRTASGPFALKDALTLAQLEAAPAPRALLRPVDEAIADLPRVDVDADAARRFRQGQAVAVTLPEGLEPGTLLQVHAADGLLGVGLPGPGAVVAPKRLF